jgi:RNA polymerase sigma-70 factor (ECF subfamily)
MNSAERSHETPDIVGIYRETVQPLYAFVSRRAGGARQLAEDVTQETFLRALAAWQNRRPPDTPLAWLQTVARNLLLNHYRRKQPESLEAMQLDEVLGSAGPVDDPDAAALVYWGLARLRRSQRRLLEAFYIEGSSMRSIADELGISERAVEGRLRRARHALRQRLTPILKNEGGSS